MSNYDLRTYSRERSAKLLTKSKDDAKELLRLAKEFREYGQNCLF